jgi:hypothetical protein
MGRETPRERLACVAYVRMPAGDSMRESIGVELGGGELGAVGVELVCE